MCRSTVAYRSKRPRMVHVMYAIRAAAGQGAVTKAPGVSIRHFKQICHSGSIMWGP